ncbi:MAG: FkbM family methyltransferase [Thermofilaceae archaeon]
MFSELISATKMNCLSDNLVMLATLSYIGKLAPRLLVRLHFKNGLAIYSTLGLLETVLRNILHVFYYRDYEIIADFRPKASWSVVDLGAFIGLYTLRSAKLVGPMGRVIAVEAFPENFKLLKLNVAENNLSNVRLLKGCAWVNWEELVLFQPHSPINASTRRDYAELMGGVLHRIYVRAFPLDSLLISLSYVDLLKIDVEGAELELISGSRSIEPEKVRRIVIEAHLPIVKPSEIAEELERRGYHTVIYFPEQTFGQAFVYAFNK